MLVLPRKPGDAIEIGEDIRVYVLSIVRGQVKIGVEAPRDVAVSRADRALLPNKPTGGDHG